MLTKDLTNLICTGEVLKRNLVCRNVKHFYAFGSSVESDVLSLNNNDYLTEFEIKISRSDFLADKRKKKWLYFDMNLKYYFPNYFYYVCEPDLIKPEEIKDCFGLVYVDCEEIQVIKKAKFIHKDRWDRARTLEKFLRVTAEREYLGCCLLTHKNREIRQRNLARGFND